MSPHIAARATQLRIRLSTTMYNSPEWRKLNDELTRILLKRR